MLYPRRFDLDVISRSLKCGSSAFICCLILLASSCSSQFHGESDTAYSVPGSGQTKEEMVVDADGTYVQTITCAAGNIITKTGHWRDAGPADYARLPGGLNSGYIVIIGAYDVSQCCSTIGLPSLSDQIDQRSDFQNPDNSPGQQTALGTSSILLAIVLAAIGSIVFFFFTRKNGGSI